MTRSTQPPAGKLTALLGACVSDVELGNATDSTVYRPLRSPPVPDHPAVLNKLLLDRMRPFDAVKATQSRSAWTVSGVGTKAAAERCWMLQATFCSSRQPSRPRRAYLSLLSGISSRIPPANSPSAASARPTLSITPPCFRTDSLVCSYSPLRR